MAAIPFSITKKKGILISLLLLLTLVNTVSAVTISPDIYMYADGFTLQTKSIQTYTYVESDGLTYWNLTEGGNITFVSGVTTQHILIERDGHYGIGNYSTVLSCNVYSPSGWTTTAFMRIYAGDNSLVINKSLTLTGSGNIKTASYTFYPNLFSLSKSKMGLFDIDIYAVAYNNTLIYYGNRTYNNLFRVYHLDDPYGYMIHTNIVSPSSINFTWTKGNNSDKTIIIRLNSTDNVNKPTKGYIVYNGTHTWFNDTLISGDIKSFTAFSYNTTTHSYSLPLYLLWGALRLQVYNETSPWMTIKDYGLLISDRSGDNSYYNNSCDNPVLLNIFSIPYGDNTIFKINASKYQAFVTYYDINPNTFYNLTFYMSPVLFNNPGEPYNISESHLYRLRVVDSISYQANPVANVKVTISKYINTTGEYEIKAIVLTNTYGEADVNLMANTLYKVKLEKDGYDMVAGQDWFTNPTFWGPNYPAIFMISLNASYIENKTFWEYSTFTGTLYENNTIHIVFIDSLCETTNMLFNVFEEYNGTLIFIDQRISIVSCGYSFWMNIDNSSRVHKVCLNITHDEYGTISVWIIINPWINTSNNEARRNWIEDISTWIFGIFSPGYINFFIIFLPSLICLLIPGIKHLELGIVLAGLIVGFISVKISVSSTLMALIPFLIFIGILYGLSKRRLEKL
jgi:hypothetical protein